jgi:3-oxoacyl-[acyl-carrier-protein] synthase II
MDTPMHSPDPDAITDLDRRGRPRVVVTGMGVKTPAGGDLGTLSKTLASGRSTAAPVADLGDELPVRFACQVADFDPQDYLSVKDLRRTDRITQMAWGAAADAVTMSGDPAAEPLRSAVVAGAGMGGLLSVENHTRRFVEFGPSRLSPLLVPLVMPNAAAAFLSIQLGWRGPTICVATACASGSTALGEACRLIRDGSADVVLAGGTDSIITPMGLSSFARMGALSRRNDDPARASRPFDTARDGFVAGEGAAFLVLEGADRARLRGARVLGEIVGYGRNCDAAHVTAPLPDGVGAADCMRAAMEDAGVSVIDVSHINAHGTSTPLNDATEAAGILKVFGPGAPPVTSNKGVLGHMIGAAGAVEAVSTLLALNSGQVPPTANHESTDPSIGLDVVSGSPRNINGRIALSNSFGFGGHNASLVLSVPRLGVNMIEP